MIQRHFYYENLNLHKNHAFELLGTNQILRTLYNHDVALILIIKLRGHETSNKHNDSSFDEIPKPKKTISL